MFWVPLAIVAAIVLFPILSALLLRFLCPRLWTRLMAVLSKSSEEKLLLSAFPSSNNSVRSSGGRRAHSAGGTCGGVANGYGYSSGGGDTLFEVSSVTKTAGRVANSVARGIRRIFSFGRGPASDSGARRTLIGKGQSQDSAPGDTLDQVHSTVLYMPSNVLYSTVHAIGFRFRRRNLSWALHRSLIIQF